MAAWKSDKNQGIDASLAILRQELESMQKQDKDLYMQLLTLQENIRGIKVELKKERDECEEAFRDLQEISPGNEPTKNRRNKSTKKERTEDKLNDKTPEEKEGNITERSWKHDRQDSGISVKICDVEASGELSHGIPSKPAIIHHSKQDSGILIDEEAVNETKLLSRLVQSSSRTFSKAENRKLQSLQNRWRQVDEYGMSGNKNHHSRSMTMSSNDLCLKAPIRSSRDPNPNSLLVPKHSHTKSCPSTSTKRLNEELCDYKVVPSHHIRPSQRSASVVDLNSLDKPKDSDVIERLGLSDNGRHVMATSEPELFRTAKKCQPLRAVLVSASEVNVSSTSERRGNLVSRQRSLDERVGHSNARSVEVKGPQRRFTVVGVKPERPFCDNRPVKHFDNGGMAKDSRFSSPSFQFPRKHARHRTMPENDVIRRRHSMHVWHASSKSWDGNMGKPRELTNLLRSTSQVSLV